MVNTLPVKERNIKCTVDCLYRRHGYCSVYKDIRGVPSKNVDGSRCLTFTRRVHSGGS